MKIKIEATNRARIEVLPLIDVVFLLLVVFIYTMLSMAVYRGLPVSLPKSTSVTPETELTLAIVIQEDHSLFVDQAPVALDDLRDVLIRKSRAQTIKGALVFADKRVSFQALFNVLDKIKDAGISNISLQAEEEE